VHDRAIQRSVVDLTSRGHNSITMPLSCGPPNAVDTPLGHA
jgi:hypothetical protein